MENQLLRDGATLYVLHEVRDKIGRPIEYNKFTICVQPDYGHGVTHEDAEKFAEFVQLACNNHYQLLAILEKVERATTNRRENQKKVNAVRPLPFGKEELERLESELKEIRQAIKAAKGE